MEACSWYLFESRISEALDWSLESELFLFHGLCTTMPHVGIHVRVISDAVTELTVTGREGVDAVVPASPALVGGPVHAVAVTA